MLFLTRWFGVTGSDAERNLAREQSDIKEITERVLLMQANAAAQQRQPLRRGTHAKGVCARAQFEVFDVTVGRNPQLAARLARGIFAKPGVYPAIVRFANSDGSQTLISSPTSDRCLSRSTLLRLARLFLARTLADRISHCKTRRLCP
jgi:catalase